MDVFGIESLSLNHAHDSLRKCLVSNVRVLDLVVLIRKSIEVVDQVR